jgi:SAM-dependent methyltransferase
MPFVSSMQINFEKLRSHIRTHGFAPTVAKMFSTVHDLFFDWVHGTETSKPAWSDNLVTGSLNKVHANRYQPSRSRPFTRLLTELKLPQSAVFVDIGAGKGRVLMLAAQFRFKRVVGVELCSRLSALAVHNVGIFRKSRPDLPVIDVVNSDAVEFRIPDGDVVMYLNNSFEVPVLNQFLGNVRRALESAPRRIWMIYSPPVYDSVVQDSGLFTGIQSYQISGDKFMVYAAEPKIGSTGA